MTHTLRKRILRTTSPPHVHGPDGRMPRSDAVIDPADLAEALRVLAIRAHHALKIAQDRVDESIRVELHDLRTAIRWLEDEFRTQQLDRMLPYVVSLRHQIESLLG
ncbi:MAG: hypothetical protein ACLP9L_40350 [Thermoguttaceae bacterium]